MNRSPAAAHREPTGPLTARSRWLAVLGLGGTVAYVHGLRGLPFGDDLPRIMDTPGLPPLFGLFTHPNPNFNWYRPIEGTLLQALQRGFGADPLPLHLIQLGIHIAVAYLVYIAALELGTGVVAAAVGSACMLLGQSGVLGVASYDTFGQVFGSLTGNLSLYLLYRSIQNERAGGRAWPALGGSLFAFALCLWSKESSVTFLPEALVVLFVSVPVAADAPRPMVSRAILTAKRGIPYAMLTVAYLVMRASVVVPVVVEGTYAFDVGLTTIKNIGLLTVSAVMPVSTVDMFLAAMEHRWLTVVGGTLATVLVGAPIAYGLLRFLRDAPEGERARRRVTVGSLVVLFFGGLFPNVLVHHVSELYIYNSMPVFAILAGIGIAEVVGPLIARPLRISVWIVLAVASISNVIAIWSKTRAMVRNGERTVALLEQLVPIAQELPQGGTLLLVHAANAPTRYSVFFAPGLPVLSYGLSRIKFLSHRPDIQVRLVDEDEAGPPPPDETTRVVCEVDDWTVRPCATLR